MTPEHHVPRYPRYLKTADACTMLGGISRETLRALVRDGVLSPPVELTRRLHLFDLAALNKVMAERRRGAA